MEATVSYLLQYGENRINKTSCKFFSDDLKPIDTNDISDIHKHLMKEHDIK